ncbi:pectate lyase-like adhesive domain-containing protein, partial [Acidisphaera rubrifaciens]|uniref:pectate lyase-like adhesive domain-containing protein n=1 Tax=Acidisphaera rubrifaciens TaxID=50715 RepID=UPI0006621265
MGTTINVSTQAELNAAIEQVDSAAAGAFTIDLTGNVTEGEAGQPAGLYVIDAATGVTVTINGEGHTLDGGGANGGLAVYAGKVTVASLTIEDTIAKGGQGTQSGG